MRQTEAAARRCAESQCDPSKRVAETGADECVGRVDGVKRSLKDAVGNPPWGLAHSDPRLDGHKRPIFQGVGSETLSILLCILAVVK